MNASPYIYQILSLNRPHIFLPYAFGNVIVPRVTRRTMRVVSIIREKERLSALTANEVELCKHDPISRIVRATLTFRYGTFLRGARIYKRERFSISLFLWRKQRHLNCKNKALFIVVSSISQRIQITRLSELLLHEQ